MLDEEGIARFDGPPPEGFCVVSWAEFGAWLAA